MNLAKLIHNPGAGDEEHAKKDLLNLIRAGGFECRYSSTKDPDWEEMDETIDFLIIAGGDGTVRDVAAKLLKRSLLDKNYIIGLLPLGTANNIAKTLGIAGTLREIIDAWPQALIKKFDVGRIFNVGPARFFLESFGYGIFPFLMQEMKKRQKPEEESPQEKIQAALELLLRIVLSYEARFCRLEVDGTDHSGRFLLVEIMNTRSIGPNLCLSPLADPGDGEFEVVMVPEKHKEKFAAYVRNLRDGVEETFLFHTLKAKNIRISWEGTHVHVDDETIKLKKSADVVVELREGRLQFLVPRQSGS